MRVSVRGGAGQRRIADSTQPHPTPAFSTPLVLLREPLAKDAGQDPRGPRWTNFLATVVTMPQPQKLQQLEMEGLIDLSQEELPVQNNYVKVNTATGCSR